MIDYHPEYHPDYYIESVNRKMKEDAYLAQFKFLTFSAGVITFDRKMSLDDLLNKVDQKMYAEKEKRHQKDRH